MRYASIRFRVRPKPAVQQGKTHKSIYRVLGTQPRRRPGNEGIPSGSLGNSLPFASNIGAILFGYNRPCDWRRAIQKCQRLTCEKLIREDFQSKTLTL